LRALPGSKSTGAAYQAPTMDAATTQRLGQLAESFRTMWGSTPLQYDLPSVAKVNVEVARWHAEYRARGSTWFSRGDRMAMCCGSFIGELVRRVAGRDELAWTTYDEAIRLDAQLQEVLGPKTKANSAFLVYGECRGFLFPWAKVYQRIVAGPEHDLDLFVRTALRTIDES
jgi:hypothetical protein